MILSKPRLSRIISWTFSRDHARAPYTRAGIGGETVSKGGGEGRFWKSKMARQRRLSRLHDAGGYLGDVPPSEV